MDFLADALRQALLLLVSPDAELLGIIALSLAVSGSAVVAATVLALPFASVLAFKRFPLKGGLLSLMNTFMGLPPVVVGLLVFLIFSRSGPLGFLELIYTPYVMVIAQFILAFPIVTAISHSAVVGVDPAVIDAAKTLGATPFQKTITIFKEARYGILSGVMAALGRVMAEVGAVLIVGGNIRGYTRVMTTTIALEADKGDFELAIALGIVLLAVSLLINSVLYYLQRKGKRQ
jgi:tungstate transport system permease protein